MPRCIHALERRRASALHAEQEISRWAIDERWERDKLLDRWAEQKEAQNVLDTRGFLAPVLRPQPAPRPFLERILDRVSPWPK